MPCIAMRANNIVTCMQIIEKTGNGAAKGTAFGHMRRAVLGRAMCNVSTDP